MMKKNIVLIAAFAAGMLMAAAPKFGEVPVAALQSLKGARGKPIRSGVVFVNGRYLPPPYVVWRRGTAIYIGDVQATGQIIPWTTFTMAQDEDRKEQYLKRIMDYRTDVDRRLRRGEILFFGVNYSMLHVEDRLGIALMTNLPTALREAGDASDLQSRLRAKGITYLNAAICQDLFANQTFSHEIEERGRMMKNESEAFKIIDNGAQGLAR